MSKRSLTGRELIKAWVAWKSRVDGARYTYKALAEDAGLNPNYLSNVMTGIRNPGGKTLEKIANAFNVTMGEFYHGPSNALSQVPDSGASELMAHGQLAKASQAGSVSHEAVSGTRQENNHEFVSLKLGGDESAEISRLFSNLGFEAGEFLTADTLNTVLHDNQAVIQEPKTEDVAQDSSCSEAENDTVEQSVPENTQRSQLQGKVLPDRLPLLKSDFTGNLQNWLTGYDPESSDYETVSRYVGSDSALAFAIVVEDDSMTPDLRPGDVLIVDFNTPFTRTDGGIGVAVTNNGIMIRRVFLQSGNCNLIPSNTNFPPVFVPENETLILKIVLWLPSAGDKF